MIQQKYIPGKPITPKLNFNNSQIDHRDFIQKALCDNTLDLVDSVCFCGNKDGKIIENYDAWGFNIPTIVCSNCYSTRSKYFFTSDSIIKFYSEGYYKAHMFTNSSDNGVGMSKLNYSNEESNKGKWVYEYVRKSGILFDEMKIYEIGCGIGGLVNYFSKIGNFKTFGSDFIKEFIEDGKTRFPETELRVGGTDAFEGMKFDLIILSDVVEHLENPRLFFSEIRNYLEPNGCVYINCPGFFDIGFFRFGCSVRQFTKIEHTYCHNLNSLCLLLNLEGFEKVIADEYVRGVFRKKEIDFNVKTSASLSFKIKYHLYLLKLKFKYPFVKVLTLIYKSDFVRLVYNKLFK